MKHTKNILKSLLIMIVAISLFTVSCSKDEGGTKTPTNPTPKNSEELLTDLLTRLGPLPTTATVIDFSKIQFDGNGNATIDGADNTKDKQSTKYKVVDILEKTFTVANFQKEKIGLKQAPTVGNPTAGGTVPLPVEIIFTANANYTFDESIITGKRYTYDASKKEAKLTLKITPKATWEN